MIADKVELSLSTYRTLLERYELGEPHVTLIGGNAWHPSRELPRLAAQADQELRSLGLLRGKGLDPDFLDTLRTLQKAQREFYTWANLEGHQFSLRGAISGLEAVIAVSNRHNLLLLPSDPDAVISDFVRQLPEYAPAAVPSASCPVEEFRSLTAGEPVGGRHLRDARLIQKWVTLPWRNAGQMFAAVRDRHGSRRRVQNPCGWHDTDAGRILVGIDTDGWVNLVSGTFTATVDKLERMFSELASDWVR